MWTEEYEDTAWLRDSVIGTTQWLMDKGAVGVASVDADTATPLQCSSSTGRSRGCCWSWPASPSMRRWWPWGGQPRTPMLLWGKFEDVE